jgi:hypothetical protein
MIYKRMRLKKYSEFSEIRENKNTVMLKEDGEPYYSPSIEPFDLVEVADDSFDCVLRAKSDNSLYFFAGEDLVDKEELADYGDPPGSYEKDDDGGGVWVQYLEDWDIESWVLEAYVNYNFSHLKYGEGLEDFELGDSHLILIDDQLKEVLKDDYGFTKI